MKELIIYHNPICSKSRQTLAILQQHFINLTIVEYLKTPLNLRQLLKLRSQFSLEDFVRTNERVFNNLQLTLENETQVLKAMLKEPILMQRPIVVYKEKAIIARSPEKILTLIKSINAI